jgi:hypothetical protein
MSLYYHPPGLLSFPAGRGRERAFGAQSYGIPALKYLKYNVPDDVREMSAY